MNDAIKVLKKFVKDCNECCADDISYRQPVEDAINEAIIALEQKENDRKQGALETYKNVLDKANRTVWDNNDWQLYTRRKIKELEEGSAKTKGFLESPRKKLGDVKK